MNKNEPVIINKAGEGYIIKPLSYMFHDEGEETFLAFSSMTELSIFLLDHFETQAGGAVIPTNSTIIGEALTNEIVKGVKTNVKPRTEPRSTPTAK